jgi:hypothetical protein
MSGENTGLLINREDLLSNPNMKMLMILMRALPLQQSGEAKDSVINGVISTGLESS